MLQIKHLYNHLYNHYYTQFRLWEYYFKATHVHYDCSISSTEDAERFLGEKVVNEIIENMMERCYAEPYKHGEPLDRERGNWEFEISEYFCNDHLEFCMEVIDGNWSGTNIMNFYCEVYK